jgi:hypothetical protein
MARQCCCTVSNSQDLHRIRKGKMQALAKLGQAQLNKSAHWTADSPLRMVRAISSDFIAQLETVMEDSGCSHVELAKRLCVTMGRVSQMMNSPGNFTLKNGVLYARSVEANVAMVVYPANGTSAPISGDVFRACWEIAGCPKNMFDIQESTVGFATSSGGMACIGHVWETPSISSGGGTVLNAGCTARTDNKPLFATVAFCS